jgi:sigma-B regulation protein RsbU (phosphoserine phosphatase)
MVFARGHSRGNIRVHPLGRGKENLVDIEKPEWLLEIEGIFDTLNEGVLVSDDCHNILYINSSLEDMVGMRSGDMVGFSAANFYTPSELEVMERQIEISDRVGRTRYEFVLPQKDGSRLPVIISTRRQEDPEGRWFSIVTFIDISDQKRAEAKLREANERLEHRAHEIEEDLALAARVQQSLAPKSIVWGGMRIDTYYHPVRTIGGDFGLVNPTDDGHLDLLVCDVSGHGIGSALVANRLYTEVLTEFANNSSLGEAMRNLNGFVMSRIGGSAFMFTMAAARIERNGKGMIFAGAGHPPAMVVTPGREPRLLESMNMVLGALPDAVGGEPDLVVPLERGDRVVLYTDGFTEVFDTQGEMLGIPGVQKIVREAALLPFSEMKHEILHQVTEWRDGPASDDMSLVLLEVL